MVRSKIEKNGYKHYFSNSVNSDKFKDTLRRIPRRTHKLESSPTDSIKNYEKFSIYKSSEDASLKAQIINNTLIKIYHYLRDEGYLIKLS